MFDDLLDEALQSYYNKPGLIRYKNKIYRLGSFDHDGNRPLYDVDGIQVGIMRPDDSFGLWSEITKN
jgi:hypothetical protein